MIREDPNIQKCPSGQKGRTMKRLLCMILAIMMLASLTAAAFADGTAAQDGPLSFPLAGVTYDIPEKYRNLKGHCDFEGGPATEEDLGIVNFSMEYYAVADEDIQEYCNYSEAFFDALLDGKEVPVPTDPSWDDTHIFTFAFEVYGLDGGRGEKELRTYLKENNGWREDDCSYIEEIGKKGDFTFFLLQYAELEEDRESYRDAMGAYYDEFVSVYTDKETFLSGLTLSEPQHVELTGAGSRVSFTTTDLNGRSISSEELLAGHKVTMINLWGTFCVPCKRELPDVQKLSLELEEKGCQLVGICVDAADDPQLAAAILKDAGVEYLNLIGTDEIQQQMYSISIPASFFVDSEGNILTEPVIGAYFDLYSQRLEEALALVG